MALPTFRKPASWIPTPPRTPRPSDDSTGASLSKTAQTPLAARDLEQDFFRGAGIQETMALDDSHDFEGVSNPCHRRGIGRSSCLSFPRGFIPVRECSILGSSLRGSAKSHSAGVC